MALASHSEGVRPSWGPGKGAWLGAGGRGGSRRFLVQEIQQSAHQEPEKQAAEFGSDLLKN